MLLGVDASTFVLLLREFGDPGLRLGIDVSSEHDDSCAST